VLIVEDEPTLLDLLESTFHDKGYRVFLAADGLEGIEAYREHMGEIAIVVTDFGLPGADGGGAPHFAPVVEPSVNVVVASGFFEPHIRSQLAKNGARALVSKPYGLTELLAVVRRVIDGNEPSP